MAARRAALALVWLASLGFASWGDASVGAAAAGDQDPKAQGERFTHARHVTPEWREGEVAEVWRDCRGCHDYTPQRQVSAPQESCDACHVPAGQAGQLARRFAAGWEKDLALYRTRTRDAFRHHTHLMLECRECHSPPPGARVAIGDYDIVTGPGQCARCHEPAAIAADDFAVLRGVRWFQGAVDAAAADALGVPRFQPPQPAQFAAFATRLAEVFGGPTGALNVGATQLPPGGAFDHADHGAMDCVACHEAIPGAGPGDLGTGGIKVPSCAQCHSGSDGKGLTAAASRAERRVQHAAGAFAHADHYRFLQPGQARREGVANAAAYAALEAPGNASCSHCHQQDPAAMHDPRADHPFVDAAGRPTGLGRHRYLDCVACHDGPGWNTGESPTAPLHDSSDGASDGKPAVAGRPGFDGCAACHEIGRGDFFAVPQAQVERIREAVFLFGGQTHPYIGLGGDGQRPELQDCAACHRGRVPELPSRLGQRPFRHAVHLPAAPGPQDCLLCHPRAKEAATSEALAGADFRTYSQQACGSCHLGAQVLEVGARELTERGRTLASLAGKDRTVQFDHKAHVAKAACADCHVVAADGRDVTTRDEARTCVQCHDHDATRGVDTNGAEIVFGDQAQSCARCHPAGAAVVAAGGRKVDVPPRRGSPAAAADARFVQAVTRFGGFAGAQFHPTDRRCTECHRADLQPDPKWPGRRVPRADHLFGESTSPHAGQGGSYEPRGCLGCHWSPMQAAGYSGAVAPSGDDELDAMRKDPGGRKARARFGNRRAGYPGGSDG
ncbi:MAG: cytochrome c3 family protein [Planctomycetota bacterium]